MDYEAEAEEVFYLSYSTSRGSGKEICLWEADKDGIITYVDWRELGDLPNNGYTLFDVSSYERKTLDSKIQDLELQLEVLKLKRERLNSNVRCS